MTVLYWVNDDGDNAYSSVNNWSTGDGVSGGDGPPGASDDIWFTSKVIDDCTVDTSVDVTSINVYYYSGIIDFNDNAVTAGNIGLGGNILMGNGLWNCTGTSFSLENVDTLDKENSVLLLNGSNLDLNCGSGYILNDIYISSGASVTINSTADRLVAQNLIVSGNFDTFPYSSLPQTNSVHISIGNNLSLLGRTKDLRNTLMSFGGNLLISGISSFSHASSIFTCTGIVNQTVNIQNNIDDLIINKSSGSVTINNFSTGNTIEVNNGTLNINNNDIYLLENFTVDGGLINSAGLSGITLTVLGDFYVSGLSLSGNAPWNLTVGGAGSVYNSLVKNSNASLGNIIYAYNTIDTGNNTNWLFFQDSERDIFNINATGIMIRHGSSIISVDGINVYQTNTDNIFSKPTITNLRWKYKNRFDDNNYYSSTG